MRSPGHQREGVALSEGNKRVSDSASKTENADIFETTSLIAEIERREVPEGYKPSENEPFMSERQLAYFRAKLLKWKADLAVEARMTLDTLKEGPLQEPDQTDRASSETDWALELRTRDRQRKLTTKIDSALRRIEGGDYGYCEITGDPISLQRLEARPIATMTLEAQERHEREERVSRDD